MGIGCPQGCDVNDERCFRCDQTEIHNPTEAAEKRKRASFLRDQKADEYRKVTERPDEHYWWIELMKRRKVI